MNNLAKLTLVGISLTSLTLMGCGRKEQPSQHATQDEAGSAEEVVKIGHVGPLTGGSSHLGKDNENGARLAVEDINKTGLVLSLIHI